MQLNTFTTLRMHGAAVMAIALLLNAIIAKAKLWTMDVSLITFAEYAVKSYVCFAINFVINVAENK